MVFFRYALGSWRCEFALVGRGVAEGPGAFKFGRVLCSQRGYKDLGHQLNKFKSSDASDDNGRIGAAIVSHVSGCAPGRHLSHELVVIIDWLWSYSIPSQDYRAEITHDNEHMLFNCTLGVSQLPPTGC